MARLQDPGGAPAVPACEFARPRRGPLARSLLARSRGPGGVPACAFARPRRGFACATPAGSPLARLRDLGGVPAGVFAKPPRGPACAVAWCAQDLYERACGTPAGPPLACSRNPGGGRETPGGISTGALAGPRRVPRLRVRKTPAGPCLRGRGAPAGSPLARLRGPAPSGESPNPFCRRPGPLRAHFDKVF